MAGLYDTSTHLWNNSAMIAVVLLALVAWSPQAGTEPAGDAAPPPAAQAAEVPSADQVAEAYRQFLLAQRHESNREIEAAIAAYERAMAADPRSAEIPAALANLQMRASRLPEAVRAATKALEIDSGNREAHRVLGLIYASAATKDIAPRTPAARQAQQEGLDRAIRHLEQALEAGGGTTVADAALRDDLARIYVIAGRYDRAIPLLVDLVKSDPSRTDLGRLLVEAYAAAGRTEEAVRWLETAVEENPQLFGTLADFYGRAQRWNEAAQAYEQALRVSPRSFDLRARYGSMLLNAGTAANAERAREVLKEAVGIRATDERALYLLSRAEHAAGDLSAAETTARRLIAQNASNPRGYSSLADVLAARRRHQDLVDALQPAVDRFRAGSESALALGLLLPRMAVAWQQLGRHDRAIAAFEELRTLSPKDPSATGDLVRALLLARRYADAVGVARSARIERPDDVWLARLEAEALRQGGNPDEAVATLGALVARRGDDPEAHMALASVYAETDRGVQAVKVLQDAQTRFPDETRITFELGAVFERQQRYADAEAAFRAVITRDPRHAPALNYLGYMLAERGERLDESVDLIRRALQVEPDNGSYLDSLGWAYFKGGQFELAETHLRQAAGQLTTNSVVLDHYGDVLFELGRLDAAIEAWTQALAGDRDSVVPADIERKIRTARERLGRR
jgi:tetratricopeptide (TPR) repeat protein